MNVRIAISIMTLPLLGIVSADSQTVANNFRKDTDLFIAQFDSIPDPDDIHSQAAVACLLNHPNFDGVHFLAVAGAYGVQVAEKGNVGKYIDSSEVFNLGFGPKALPSDTPIQRAAAGWVDAHGDGVYTLNADGQYVRPAGRVTNMAFACEVIAERAKPVLEAGGRVFVMEAGQSDLTAEWVEKLINEGIKNTGTNVILVQHSNYNERKAPGYPGGKLFSDEKNDWEFINNPRNLTYRKIDDGNYPHDTTVDGRDHGNENTPDFKIEDDTIIASAIGDKNPNTLTKKLWTLAFNISREAGWDFFTKGYVDFSDAAEALWIFDLAHESNGIATASDFFERYVTYTPEE